MKLSLPFVGRMSGVTRLPDGAVAPVDLTPVRQQFRRLKSQIVAGWNIEHNPDGSHGAVTAESCAVAGLFRWGTTLYGHRDGVLTPATITANTDNYNPPGLSTAWMLRLQSDASRNLTGLQAPAAGTTHYPFKLIVNISSQAIVLVEFATSTLTNRFSCPGATDLTLNQNDAVWIFYDLEEGTPRWRVMGF